jgi:ubiquinone/menaquinone biosynthesis C-methylase UbiE
LHRWVFDQLQLPPESCILELGCGPADLWQQNVGRIPKGWQITLSDASAGMVERAQENLRDIERSFDYRVVDAQAIPYEDESYDAVIANHMLYHVPDRPAALSEIRRILRPGGRLYAATNGGAHLRELYELRVQFDPKMEQRIQSIVEAFTLENVRDQLTPWFSQVTLLRYEDGLRVTEAEPLIAYVASASMTDKDGLAAFAAHIRQQLAKEGVICITKESGMFVAYRDG